METENMPNSSECEHFLPLGFPDLLFLELYSTYFWVECIHTVYPHGFR